MDEGVADDLNPEAPDQGVFASHLAPGGHHAHEIMPEFVEVPSLRKCRLFHGCWKAILRDWDMKTRHTRDIIWADSTRRQTRFFCGAFLGDQQVFCVK